MTTETPIRAPFVDGDDLSLRLNLGACRLVVRAAVDSGDGDGAGPTQQAWVEGTYTDPTGDNPIRLEPEGQRLTIRQERTVAGSVRLVRGAPTCELRLGTARPYALEVRTGASDVDLYLGGVPLRHVDVKAGAGRIDLSVDRPNPVDATDVSIGIGAGLLEAVGLGNLATERLNVEAGATNVVLDLGGELRRPLDARVTASMSRTRIVLPADRPARVTTNATLAATDLGDGFRTREGALLTLADGDPVITLHATVSVGALQLRTVPPA